MNNEVLISAFSETAQLLKPTNINFSNSTKQKQPSMNTLLIDADFNLFNKVGEKLSKTGISLTHVFNTNEALEEIKKQHPDCIIYHPLTLDAHAFDFVKQTGRLNYTGGLIVVSLNRNVEQQIRALNEGADAFLPLPVDTNELTARIKSLSRYNTSPEKSYVVYNELKLDKPERRFYINDELIFLTQTEFDILLYLIDHKGKIVTRDELIINCWNEKHHIERYKTALYSHIKNVKKKIYDVLEKEYIQTVYGVGYGIRDNGS